MSTGSDLRHADSPYDVVAYRPGEPLHLPDGYGALAVRTSCPPGARRATLAPIVGVDGQPAVYGWGEAAVLLPAGTHVVEIQYTRPVASRQVTIAAGEVESLEYAAPRNAFARPSVGRRPRRSRGVSLGTLGLSIVAAWFVFVAGLLVFVTGLHASAAVAAPVLAVLGLGIVAGTLWRGRRR